ncbi:MAG: NAD(+)/NADH kinase [Planctomycetaceae bacterium]|jgi:NAD+ kinase|nr:NAD(+)/NADH kinase [Planctomycetaceae bacterium]
MRIILLGNGRRDGVLETAGLLRPEIERHGEVVAADFYGQENIAQLQADVVIVFGGDGSILRAVNQMGQNQIPVIAVHLGTISFLSTVRSNELVPLLSRSDLLQLPVIEHLLLDCKLFRQGSKKSTTSSTVLNEVLVQGETVSRIISLGLYVDGDLVTTYRCDGLIVSTPVGSTAHSLSAGGPILRNDIDAVVISPISPHTLSNRPLVDSPDRLFEIRPCQKGILVLDGVELARVEPNDFIQVSRAPYTFKTIDAPGNNYYKTLRNKLGWSGQLNSDFGTRNADVF